MNSWVGHWADVVGGEGGERISFVHPSALLLWRENQSLVQKEMI